MKSKNESISSESAHAKVKDSLLLIGKDSFKIIVDMVNSPESFSGVSKNFYRLFPPQNITNALLIAVVQGNQDKVERLPCIRALLEKGDVTDYSNRHFKQITAYQYALWALDRRMVRVIERKASQIIGLEGENLKKSLLKQRAELKNSGIVYHLGDIEHRETCYNFQALIDSYQIFSHSWLQRNSHVSYHAWHNLVEQQRLMPAHVVQELCHSEFSVNKIPTFREESQVRFSSFVNSLNKYVLIFPWGKNLNEDFLLVKTLDSPGISRYLLETALGNTKLKQPGVEILWIASLMSPNRPNHKYSDLFRRNGMVLHKLLKLRAEELKPEPEFIPQKSHCVLS